MNSYKGFQCEPIEGTFYNNGNRDYIVRDGEKSTVVMNSNLVKLRKYIDDEIIRQEYEHLTKTKQG